MAVETLAGKNVSRDVVTMAAQVLNGKIVGISKPFNPGVA